jgi:peptidoglycan hydrolase-like protein with peptidoglycan-binding domain
MVISSLSMFKPLLIWLLTISLFIIIVFSTNNQVNTNNQDITFVVLDILIGIISWLFFANSIDKTIHNKYSGIKASFISAVIILSSLIGGFIIIFISFTFFPIYNQPKSETKVASYKLVNSGIKLGSTGEEVRIVQAALAQDKNIYPSGIVNGYYGNLTREAVINLQNKYSLNQTGEFDNLTTNKFNEIYGSKTRGYYLNLFPTATVNNNQNSSNIVTQSNNTNNSDQEWGTIRQVGKVEYRGRFGNDPVMATPNEIFIAVNNYRNQNGKGSVSWDDGLAAWAQSRATLFANSGLDQHAGFEAEVQSKAKSMGLKGAGEDAAQGGAIAAVHLIEWSFAQDEPHKAVLLHDSNLLGVGVASGPQGYGVDLIFGSK